MNISREKVGDANFLREEVANASFRTDKESDQLNDKFMSLLGLEFRYMPARLAIARSLAIPSLPDPLPEKCDLCRTIKGHALFGSGVIRSIWISMLVERSEENEITLRKLQKLVAVHWRRGIHQLNKEWEQDESFESFIHRILDHADLRRMPANRSMGHENATGTSSQESISVPVGELAEEFQTGEIVSWDITGAGGSPHAAIMGGVGSGKTRTAVAIIHAIHEKIDVPIIAFDFKGDLGTDPNGGGYHLDQTLDAPSLNPPRQAIPLNVLTLQSRDDVTIAEAASRFRDSFGILKNTRLGDIQRNAIHEAASKAFRQNEPCELKHIYQELRTIYKEREMKEDGAMSAFNEICRFPLFEPRMTAEEFFSHSRIIKLPSNVVEEIRGIVINLVLDSLDQYLNSLSDAPTNADGSRKLRVCCIVDEAHRILGTKLPSLSNLIRMSRSKGGAIMLISQSPDDFSGEKDDFLTEMGLVVAFATNAHSRATTRILGRGANLANLQTGQCYVKRRGDQMARKVQAWQTSDASQPPVSR